MKIFKGLISLLKSDPVQDVQDAIERAVHHKAELSSNHEFKRVMANFHTERVLEIDHTKDWWGYANHRQKQTDFQYEAVKIEGFIAEAEAKIQALKQSLTVLQVERNDTSAANS